MNRNYPATFATRCILASSIAASLTLSGCGAGGGGGDAVAIGGSIVGSVTLDGAAKGLLSPGSEAEPNDQVFQVQDLGDLGADALELHGTVGGKLDAADFARFGVALGGRVRVAAKAAHKDTIVTVFVVKGGKGQPRLIARSAVGNPVDIAAQAGDHVIVGFENATARAGWSFAATTEDAAAVPAPIVSVEDAAKADATLLPKDVEVVAGELIVSFAKGDADGRFATESQGLETVASNHGFHLVKAVRSEALLSTRTGNKALADLAFRLRRKLSGVRSIEPNYLVRLTKEPNDTLYKNGTAAWQHKLCKAPAAWDKTTGNGVVVAIVDTGILFEHEDLKANVLRDGYDFVDNDSDPSDPLRAGAQYHGSHVAGIVAAATNNGKGVAGVCWNAKILPVRVLGTNGTGSTFGIAQAVLYAAGLKNQSGTLPKTKAKVINLSLGGGGHNQVMADAVKRAQAAGAIVLAAAGNEFQKNNPISYPANYPGVIGVGSVGPTKKRAYYSNTGAYVDIVAPGGDQSVSKTDGILSTVAVQYQGQYYASYDYQQGTSMACPYAAGVVALMLSVNPSLNTSDVMTVFQSTSEDLGAPGRDNAFGHGLIDASKCVQGSNLPIRLSRSSVSFTAASTIETVKITSGNGTAMPVALDTAGAANWLMASLVGTTTPAELRLTINRAAVPAGPQKTSVKITSGTTSVTVEVAIGSASGGGGGQPTQPANVWVVDGNSQIVAQTSVNAQGLFQITGLPAGGYNLMFGIDSNKNGKLGDSGDWAGQPLTVIFADGETLNVGALKASYVQ